MLLNCSPYWLLGAMKQAVSCDFTCVIWSESFWAFVLAKASAWLSMQRTSIGSLCYNAGKLLHCHSVGSVPARSKMDLVLKRLTLHTYLPSLNQHLMHQVTLFNYCCDMFHCSSAPSSRSVTSCMRGGALNVGLMNPTFEDEHRAQYVQYSDNTHFSLLSEWLASSMQVLIGVRTVEWW